MFIETSRLSVNNKSLDEVRELMGGALVRNGVDPEFQLEVRELNSQKFIWLHRSKETKGDVTLIVNKDVKGTGSHEVTERLLTLRELLVISGLEISRSDVWLSQLTMRGVVSQTVEGVFSEKSPDYYLTGGGMVRSEKLN